MFLGLCVTTDEVWTGWIGFTDSLYTPLGTTLTHATSILSLLQPPLDVSWQWLLPREILQHPTLRSWSQLPMQNSCQLTTQLTGSQVGGHFTPTSLSSLHRLTFDWTLSPNSHFMSLHSTELLTTNNFNSETWLTLLIKFRQDHTENTVSTVTVQQYFYHCMRIRCQMNPFTKQLPCDSLGIVDMFTGCNQVTHVSSRDRCIATAIHATIYNATAFSNDVKKNKTANPEYGQLLSPLYCMAFQQWCLRKTSLLINCGCLGSIMNPAGP
jgi:hypothetical protein